MERKEKEDTKTIGLLKNGRSNLNVDIGDLCKKKMSQLWRGARSLTNENERFKSQLREYENAAISLNISISSSLACNKELFKKLTGSNHARKKVLDNKATLKD